jgi:ribosomal protein L3
MNRAIRRIAAPAAVLALIAAAATLPAQAASTKTCHLSGQEAQHLGPTYVTDQGKAIYRVRGTSCANGKKVIKAYHSCRKTQTGRCVKKVLGFACRETRSNQLMIGGKVAGFDASVVCTKGSARVSHKYTEQIAG